MRFRIVLFILPVLLMFGFSSVRLAYALDPNQIAPDASQNGTIYYWGGSGTTGPQVFGRPNPSDGDIGFKYIPEASHFICQVDWNLVANANPSDGLQMKVYQNGTNLTNGDLIQTSINTVAGTSMSTVGQVSFWFGSITPPGICFAVVAGDTYWFRLHRTGSQDSTHNYSFYYYDGSSYQPSGVFTSMWGDRNGEMLGLGHAIHPMAHIYGILDGSSIGVNPPTLGTFCSTLGLLAGTCNMFASLLVPDFSTGALNTALTTFETNLNSKAPFSYFASVASVSGSLTGSVATQGASFSIPLTGATAYGASMPASITWTATPELQTWIDKAKYLTTVLFWGMFLLYLLLLRKRILPT